MTKKLIISIKEAREILGKEAENMSDDEVESVIETLDIIAIDALTLSREELLRKRDAQRLAKLIYDVYRDKNQSEK